MVEVRGKVITVGVRGGRDFLTPPRNQFRVFCKCFSDECGKRNRRSLGQKRSSERILATLRDRVRFVSGTHMTRSASYFDPRKYDNRRPKVLRMMRPGSFINSGAVTVSESMLKSACDMINR